MLLIKHTESQRSLPIPFGLMDAMGTCMELHRVHMPEFEVSCEVRPLEDM